MIGVHDLGKIAKYNLGGPAVEQFDSLVDNNGDTPAEETRAIANFKAFLPKSIETVHNFFETLEKVSRPNK
jgi:hypothetical protein